jgi:hypothetical protein
MKDKTDSLQSKLSDETIIEFAIDPAIEHENSVSKQEVCKESNELSCGDDRMITKMKDKTDSLQSKLSDETIIEFAIDPAIEHEHSVSKQGVCKESNELSCGDDRMITKMKDKTDSLQSKLSDETIIEFAIDPAIEHENSVSKQEVCKESNELSCGDDRMTCKSQIIKDEHSKTEKENNNSDILNELLAKEGISSNKKSKKLFDIFFSFFNENENDLLSLKKENNKLKERIKVLSRENDFKNICYIFLVDSFSKLNSSFMQLKNEYNSIVIFEKNNRLENESLDRENDKLTKDYNKIVVDFNKLGREYNGLFLLKKNSDKEKEALIYRNKYLEEENIKLKLEYDGWNENKMQLIRELASLKVGSQSRLQHDQLFERFKQFKEQDIHDLIFKISSAFNVNGQTRRKLMASIKKDIAEIIFIKNSPRLHEDKILKPMIDGFFDKLKITDSVSAELYLLCEKTLIKGFTLVEDASQAVPPANFYFVEANALFNEHKHEANVGCVTEGNIEFTIFPAYIVSESEEKQRVFEKALVWTNEEIRL